jgi:SAM-dependent methyltransferase
MNTSTSNNPFLMDPFESAHDRNTVRRHEATIAFIGEISIGDALDIGERNPLTERLEGKYSVHIRNTSGDLDNPKLNGVFDSIFCFEVIEHLMNPLNLLLEIRRVLRPSGRLFLSTPKHKPHFLWGQYHFTEFDEERLRALVTRAGFEIRRKAEFRTMPIWWHFLGIRPLIRFFHNKVFILELKPNP